MEYEGTLYALTNGRNNSSHISAFNGREFVQVFESGIPTFGSNPRQGSIELYQNSIHFVTNTSRLYQFYKGGLHERTRLTNGTNEATEVGMLKNLYQAQLFCGVEISGPAYRVYYQNQFINNYVNAEWRGRQITTYDDGRPLERARFTKCRVYFSQNGSGASCRISFFKDRDAMIIGGVNDQMGQTITNAGTSGRLYHSIPLNITDVNSFYINILFNHTLPADVAMVIRKIVFEVEETRNV